MDIGIGLPNTVPGTEGRRLVDWAKNAEEAGFSTLGTIGRLVYPNYEELIALAAAAAVTSRIRLTTSVLLAPLYSNTALFAKQAASLDRLSGGRLVLGLGLGGRDDDFTASALPTAGKGRRLDQQLTEMKRIWAGERYGYAGAIGPEPVRRGGPELILGGAAQASFRRVALLGDGWIMGGGTPDMFAEAAAGVDNAWAEAGRPGKPRKLSLAYFALGRNARNQADQLPAALLRLARRRGPADRGGRRRQRRDGQGLRRRVRGGRLRRAHLRPHHCRPRPDRPARQRGAIGSRGQRPGRRGSRRGCGSGSRCAARAVRPRVPAVPPSRRSGTARAGESRTRGTAGSCG